MRASSGRSEPGGSGSAPIHVRTRFERFPAAVKGAFVVRGADGNPHAIRVEWARVARFPSGDAIPFPAEERILDANPIRDLFVPFEAPVLDLQPGWYVIESSVQVDGAGSWVFASRPFSVPWPRSEMRRATIPLGKGLTAGDQRFGLDRVELNPNWSAVIWKPVHPKGGAAHEESDEVEAAGILIADGEELEILPDDAAGIPQLRSAVERRTVSYPVRRSSTSLAVMMRLPSGDESERFPVPLK
ncbi:MAG TPA: hypothetical protein VHI54_09640 [Actinomycetota bacterium]|nr:hypothetical protein [Actinomycetota bacterium]